MCRLVIRTKDNHQRAGRAGSEKERVFRDGDIIEVLEDGVSAGTEGERRTDWLIIELPGVPARRYRRFCQGGEGDDGPKRMYRLSRMTLREFLHSSRRAEFDANRITLIGPSLRGKVDDSIVGRRA